MRWFRAWERKPQNDRTEFLRMCGRMPAVLHGTGVNTGRKVQRLSPVEMCNAHNPCSLILTIETSFMRWSV